MIHLPLPTSLDQWREMTRPLLSERVPPGEIAWAASGQAVLFQNPEPALTGGGGMRIPRPFIELANAVSCFDDDCKWHLLYRIAYRLTNGESHLLAIESDPDVRQAKVMEKAIRRDIHKFHAFVRFRRIEAEGQEIFIAWHEPQHFTVELASPFFMRRFGEMKFSILTPKGSAHWDTKELSFGPAAERSSAPTDDETEDFWLLYYRSIYNPFRLNVKAMKRELPVRHWPTLPESALIAELVRKS